MAARFHAATIERIKDAADIVALTEERTRLRKSGKGYVGLCPFHSERTPSFYVSQERGRCHCFGCGADYDAIGFVQAIEKCGFPVAVRKLASRFGIALDNDTPAHDERERRERADAAAWRVHDRIGELRSDYMGCLHRCDRLCAAIGQRLRAERNPRLWDELARLAVPQAFYFVAFQFFTNATPATLARFASTSPTARRKFFFEVSPDAATSAAN